MNVVPFIARPRKLPNLVQSRTYAASQHVAWVMEQCDGNLHRAATILSRHRKAIKRFESDAFRRCRRLGGNTVRLAQIRIKDARRKQQMPNERSLRKAVTLDVFIARHDLRLIEKALEAYEHDHAAAAQALGIHKDSLSRLKLKRSRTLAAYNATRPVRRAGSGLRGWLRELGVAVKAAALQRPEVYAAAKTAYRARMLELHPDRGGSHEAASALNALWEKIERSFAKRARALEVAA